MKKEEKKKQRPKKSPEKYIYIYIYICQIEKNKIDLILTPVSHLFYRRIYLGGDWIYVSVYFCRPVALFRSFFDRRRKKQQHLVSLTTSTLGGEMGVLSFATGSSSCDDMTFSFRITHYNLIYFYFYRFVNLFDQATRKKAILC